MSLPSITWIEVNITNGRKTRLRADKVLELRDDFSVAKKGADRVPIVRVIMEGGTNIVVENETVTQFWDRLQVAMQRPFFCADAPPLAREVEEQ
jgi:hypothetical protein